ncbi:MAG: hypothetical protein AAF657_18425 [Acidobacteriota bacterium]
MKSRTAAVGSVVAFHRSRGLLWLEVANGVFFGGMLLDALIFHQWLVFAEMRLFRHQIPLVVVALVALPFAIKAARELLDQPTRLGADASGLWAAQTDEHPGYHIPWTAVREFAYRVEEPRRDRCTHWLELRLQADAWQRPAWLADGSRVDLPLVYLDRSPAEVYGTLRSCWERWRRRRLQASGRPARMHP